MTSVCATIRAVKAKIVEPSVLSEYVRRIMGERDLDAPTVEARARKRGYNIDRSYVNKILANASGHMTVPKLQALAAGLDVSEDEIFAVARGVKEPEGFAQSLFWQAYRDYEELELPLHRRMAEGYMRDLIEMLKPAPRKKAEGSPRVEALRKSR